MSRGHPAYRIGGLALAVVIVHLLPTAVSGSSIPSSSVAGAASVAAANPGLPETASSLAPLTASEPSSSHLPSVTRLAQADGEAAPPLPAVSVLEAVLAVGDVVSIEVVGEPIFSGQYSVQPNGAIAIPLLGEVMVAGMTTQAMATLLEGSLQRYVVRPVVKVVRVGGVPAMVYALGQVVRPGSYALPLAQTALALLAGAGGALPTGDLAEAVVYRRGLPEKLVPGGVLLDGMLPRDLQLEAGDILFVPEQRPGVVMVAGAVINPGLLPLREADNAARALLMAGGPTTEADPARGYILRGVERVEVDLGEVMGEAAGSAASRVALQDKDVVVVPPAAGLEPVTILGAVNTPGPKTPRYAGRLSQAIASAGGLAEEADLQGAFLLRRGERIEVNLAAVIERGEAAADVALQPGDTLMVPKAAQLVYALGRIAKPGSYEVRAAPTLLDLWALVGEPLPDANLRNCSIVRGEETISVDLVAVADTAEAGLNLALRAGDKLIVPQIMERVYVFGAVARPGPYPVLENETLLDVLGKAGGTALLANINKIMLLRPIDPGEVRAPRPTPRVAAAPAEEEPSGPSYVVGRDPVRQQPRPSREPARTTERVGEDLGVEFSLEVLATTALADAQLRPQHGDVLYVPAREERLSRADYERILIGLATAMFIGRLAW